MKKLAKKKAGLWLAIGAGVLAVCVAVILCAVLVPGSGQQEQPAQDYTVYWNVDRLAFQDAETGLNNRTANSSGYFPIVLSFNGEQKEFLAADKPLVAKMDTLEMFGIVQDENGIIVDILQIEEFTGGYVAERFYVESVSEDSFTANSSKTLKGESVSYSLEAVKVYSVVGEGFLVGMPTQLRQNDRIIGVIDTDGNLTHVYVVETLGPTEKRYCDHCEMEVDWIGWNDPEHAPDSTGHYYLLTDVQLTYQVSIAPEQSIVLDLNGYKITGGEGRRVYSLHNEGVYLGIMDYSTERTGKLEAWGQGAHVQGGCVWVRYGLFELFSGTLDASRMRTDLYGVAVCVNKEMTMNMYGGTIIGGTSITYTNPNTGKKMGSTGGAVYIDGTANISGGVIRDGISEGYIDSATGKYMRGISGNVHVTGNGTLNMTGGSILNGLADGDAGNLYVSGTANISGDVTISGGTAKQEGKRGGNILVAGTGKLTMTGGQVTGGTSGGSGGNIYSSGETQLIGVTVTGGKSTNTQINNISAYSKTCLLRDCTVNGDVSVAKDCKLTLSGATRIEKGENYGLKVTNEVMIEPGELTDGADITVTATGYFSDKTNTAVAKYFRLSCEGGVLAAGGRLFAGKRYCLCGSDTHASYCDGTKLLWQAWTDAEKMPTSDGNYYLTSNVKLSKRATVGKAGGTKEDARNVVWDLNGYTVTGAKGSRVAFVTGYSTLSICDTKGSGKLQATGAYTENGHTVFGGSDTVINIYGGTVTGGNTAAILKTTTDKEGNKVTKAANGQGGNLYTYGVLNMYGGTITGGVARAYYNKDENKYSYGYGGNVAIASQGAFNFYGGTIENGVADQNGGNLYTAANVTMTGGIITGGSVAVDGKSGGNIYLTGTCAYNMQGGSVTRGNATSNGGNVMSYGQFNLSGGSVTDGTARNLGGNICVGSTGAATISGGTVSGGFAKSGTDAQGNVVLESTAASANIIAMKDSSFAITGGQLAPGIRVLDGCALTLGGSPVIEGISLGGNTQAIIDGILGENARIVLSKDRNGYFAVTQEAANADKFTLQPGFMAELDQEVGMLKFAKAPVVSDHNHCICGDGASALHTCQSEGFLPWGNAENEKSTLPTSGSYYLTSDIVLTDLSSGSGICKVEDSLSLCLNGYTVTTEADCARRMFHVSGGKLSITDCSEEQKGAITAGYETYTAEGGLMLVGSNSELNLYAGTLSGTNLIEAAKNGGTLRSYGTINIYGGTVTGGTAVNGGNIAAGGPLNIYGGVITGGIATGNGGNVWISGGTVAVLVSDCQITAGTAAKGGGLYVNGKVKVSGNVNITDNTGGNLYVPAGKQITVEELAESSVIGVTATGYFGIAQNEADSLRFTSDDPANEVKFDEAAGMLQIVQAPVVSDHEHCLCADMDGHDCQNMGFLPWGNLENEKTSLPTTGSYYLTCDIILSDPGSGSGICKVEDSLSLCLNGYTVTTEADCARRMFHVSGGKLSITDCSEEQKGNITAGYETYTAEGGLMLVGSNSELNLYAGTLSGTNLIEAAKNGGTLRSYGTINIYGGTVTGGTAVNGGNIAAGGPLNIYGGAITGGIATGNGGNIWISSGTVAILVSDCQITAGTAAKGGGLYVNGSVTLAGDVNIIGNTGSNLYVPEGKQITVEALTETSAIGFTATGTFANTELAENALRFSHDDGVSQITFENNSLSVVTQAVQGHSHCICGGNDKHTGCADVTWAPISGQISSLDSGYYYLEDLVELTGSITIGSGKDVYICLNGKTMTAADGQRAFLINSGGQLHIADCGETGKLTGDATTATANLNGGVIFIMKGTLELFGGTIESRNTVPANTQNGGTVRVGNTATNTGTFRMYGGTVTGGASQKGGNLYIRSGLFEMYGGLITGGTATTAGDNLFVQNTTDAVAILSGGTINGGVHLDGPNGTLTITGTATEEQ